MKRNVSKIFRRGFFFYLVTLALVTSQSVSNELCGISGSATGFIFHGELSERGQYPWTVSLHLVKNDAFICGGTLLSSKLVSTAAHCIHDKGRKHRTTPEEIVVKLGKYDLEQQFERGSVTAYIDEIYVHPNWKNYTLNFDSDIAIISLETPAQYTNLIFPICLWDQNDEPSAKIGTVVGWGRSERGGSHETKPREIEINIKTNEECFLTNPRLAGISSFSTFCAGNPQQAKSVCLGDSGSGLLVRDKGIWYLKGIVSSSLRDGESCDVRNYAIYTNVFKMMDWIKEIFRKTGSSMPQPSIAGRKHKKEIVCFIAYWAKFVNEVAPAGSFTLDNFKPELCSTAVLYYGTIDEEGDTIANTEHLNQLKRFTGFKKSYPHLRTLLSIGGWNEASEKFSKLSANPQRRQRFARNTVNFLKRNDLDGLNIFWEYPTLRGGDPADKGNFVALLKDIKEAYSGENLYLSATLRGARWITDSAYDIGNVAKNIDAIYLMTFDLAGPWDNKVGYHAPLYGDGESIHSIVSHYIDQGAPAEKLLVGVPFYGRTFITTNAGNIGYSANSAGFQGSLIHEDGFLGYNEYCKDKTSFWSETYDDISTQSIGKFSGGGKNNVFTFDTPRSVANKAKYVVENGLAGIWAWSVDVDDFKGFCKYDDTTFNDFPVKGPRRTTRDYPLLRTINEAFDLL